MDNSTKFNVNWDNGANACGTFPDTYDTKKEAEQFGNSWMDESNLRDLGLTRRKVNNRGGEGCYTFEVIEVEVETELDEEELIRREVWE